MSNNDKIKLLQDITHVDREVCISYLNDVGWDVEKAVTLHFALSDDTGVLLQNETAETSNTLIHRRNRNQRSIDELSAPSNQRSIDESSTPSAPPEPSSNVIQTQSPLRYLFGFTTGIFSTVQKILSAVLLFISTIVQSQRSDFVSWFENKYGEKHPKIHNNISEAFRAVKQEDKLLIIFITDYFSPENDHMCCKILGNDDFIGIIDLHTILWAGDAYHLGEIAKWMPRRRFPSLTVLKLTRQSDEMKIIDFTGGTTDDEIDGFLARLIVHGEENANESIERQSRLQSNRSILEEQDRAYEIACQLDKKRIEEEKKAKLEASDKEALRKKRIMENEKIDEKRKEQAEYFKNNKVKTSETSSLIRMRLSSGKLKECVFENNSKLQHVYDWAGCLEFIYPEKNLKIPKKFYLATMHPFKILEEYDKSLKDLGLFPTASIALQNNDEEEDA
eukprot:GHVL01020932.1.p1 GENE.GHVL01020932.1~~GHVL01020932.1.p1  ORF type:complete len:448 (+),score=123.00 GHVL01020932.1:194-1537(+)